MTPRVEWPTDGELPLFPLHIFLSLCSMPTVGLAVAGPLVLQGQLAVACPLQAAIQSKLLALLLSIS